MGILKKLSDLFAPPGSENYSYWMTVKCNRCGENIRARVDMRNDLSVLYGEGEGKAAYYCRKVLIGDQHCFQKMEVELTFDNRRRLIDRQVSGGEFVDDD
jgi:hypothetical protein